MEQMKVHSKWRNKMRKLTITFIILDVLVAICFFVVYSPLFKTLQYTIISTAINTKTHDYIAYTFYSEEHVNKVVSQNNYIPISETINLDDVIIDTSPKDNYDNPYDEAILTRDEGNEEYKYLKIKVGKYDAHLVAIYHPEKVRIITCKKFNTSDSSGKESVLKMSNRLGFSVGINGGGFVDYGNGSDIPIGYVIKDGKIIWSTSNKKADLIGFTQDNKLLLVNATGEEAIEMGMRDALQFGPFLMVNGEKMKFSDSAGGYSRAARTAIAQRKDGVVLFLVTEGTHTAGPNMKEVIDALSLYGAYNAANLDGGSSVQMVVKGKVVNTPKNIYGKVINGGKGRNIVTGWGLFND